MNTRADKEKQKQIQEKCQIILGNLLREEDNKYCVDCDAKGPRWASWNLGIFLCIRCAGIHRNLGVHISKVKSVNLDTWTPEQVACLQQMGNSQARAVYEANLPDNFRRPQTDSSLEALIRAKYEQKKYIAKEWVPPPAPKPARSLEAFIRAKYEQKKYIAKEWVPPPAPKPAFDIEEDKRREREKKRMRTKVANTVEIPQVPQQPAALPRPHSAGPQSTSPIAITQETSETKPFQAQQQSTTDDLLSLDVSYNQPSDDPFDAFLSAPQASVATTSSTSPSPVTTSEVTASASNKSADEADFFNQTNSTDIPKKNMMTKESILSLYSSGSSQAQQTQPQPPIYGIPGGMYVGQQVYPQMPIPGIATAPSQGIPNGITSIPQIPGVQQPGSNMGTVTNPFTSLGAPTLGQEMGQHAGTWVTAPAGSGTNPLIMAHGIGQEDFGDSNTYDLMWDIKDISRSSYRISNTVPFTNICNLTYQMPAEYQLQQRMANIQLSGQAAWNVAGVTQVSSTGMVIGGSQPASGMVWPGAAHGQTLSTNLWQ